MRILHSIVLDGWSAGSWYAVNIARQLGDLGHDNLFVCRPNCRTCDEAIAAGLSVDNRVNLEEKNPLRMIGNLSRLGQLLVDWKPDVICAHWGEDHAYWGLLKSLYRERIPLVRVRSLDPKPPKAHRLSRRLHEKMTALVIVSNAYLRKCYLDLFCLSEQQVCIVPPGLDFAPFKNMTNQGTSAQPFKAVFPTVGLLARFSPIKGHRYFFEAARLVKEKIPEVRFLLAGFESEYSAPDIRDMAQQAGVEDCTEIIGHRDGPSAPIVARFDVGVVSSVYSESVSRAMMENLAAGVPVVATDVGGVPDILNEGDFGNLVPPEDPGALADGIVQLLTDHDRRHQAGQSGREFIRTRRTWPRAVELFVDALSTLVKPGQ